MKIHFKNETTVSGHVKYLTKCPHNQKTRKEGKEKVINVSSGFCQICKFNEVTNFRTNIVECGK